VLITHKLDEVVDISDTITVMRAGTTVERIRTAETRRRGRSRGRWWGRRGAGARIVAGE
jgi:simple sugar transport system ATP-binding protein